MESPLFNSQRGVSYVPGVSKNDRDQEAQRVEAEIQALSPKRAHARKLDQIESAYRERARDRGRPTQ